MAIGPRYNGSRMATDARGSAELRLATLSGRDQMGAMRRNKGAITDYDTEGRVALEPSRRIRHMKFVAFTNFRLGSSTQRGKFQAQRKHP